MALHLDQLSFDSFQEGNRDIFIRIYAAYEDEIYLFCFRLLKNKENTKDATAMTMTMVWEKRTIIQGPNTLHGFIYVVARNICLKLLKEQSRKEEFIRRWRDDDHLEDSIPADTTERFLDRIEARVPGGLLRAIGLGMNDLADQRRKVFRLLYLEHKSPKEVAELMNIDRDTVYEHKKQALNDIYKAIMKKILPLLLIITGLYLLFS